MAERTKMIHCDKCHMPIQVYGSHGTMKEVSQGVTCPHCNHPNETDWPMDASIAGRKPTS